VDLILCCYRVKIEAKCATKYIKSARTLTDKIISYSWKNSVGQNY